MSEDTNGQDLRKAIIVGVDKYEYEGIGTLAGAENDAREIQDRLEKNGEFNISPGHMLVGPDATRRKILTAVSEVFRQDTKCSLVIFYFSGHGIIDKTKEGYIAPYDMDPADPLINGIKMEELREVIYKSKNDATVVILLDCCYAGIATQGAKSASVEFSSHTDEKHLYSLQLQRLVETPQEEERDDLLSAGRGILILASSEATAVSREKNYCKHFEDDKPHSHGIFTFHLLEGLDGKAADKDGLITVGNVRHHIEDRMKTEPHAQRPFYYAAEATQIDSIWVTKSKGVYDRQIKSLLNNSHELLAIKYQDSDLVDIQCLADAAKTLGELIKLDPKNDEIPSLKESVELALNNYARPTIDWLSKNTRYARKSVNEISPGIYDHYLPELFMNLSTFEDLQKIDQSTLTMLINLSAHVASNYEFTSIEDRKLKIFQWQIRASFRKN